MASAMIMGFMRKTIMKQVLKDISHDDDSHPQIPYDVAGLDQDIKNFIDGNLGQFSSLRAAYYEKIQQIFYLREALNHEKLAPAWVNAEYVKCVTQAIDFKKFLLKIESKYNEKVIIPNGQNS